MEDPPVRTLNTDEGDSLYLPHNFMQLSLARSRGDSFYFRSCKNIYN